MLYFYLTSVNTHSTRTDSERVDSCLLRLAGGDTAALGELYSLTSASVYGFALSILKNTHDAQDAAHDVYINVCNAVSAYKSCAKPMAWILTITRNLCLHKLRDRAKTADLPQEDWEPYIQANPALPPEEKLIISQCMTVLSDDERQIVLLHAVSGYKHREIAAFMSMPLATVLTKYNRALKKLKHAMTEGEPTDEKQRA